MSHWTPQEARKLATDRYGDDPDLSAEALRSLADQVDAANAERQRWEDMHLKICGERDEDCLREIVVILTDMVEIRE